MSIVPVHCRVCSGVFLPATGVASAAVQCPHCSAQMWLGDCIPAATPAGADGQEYVRVTEEEETAQRDDSVHRKWMRRVFIATSAAAAVAVGVFIWQHRPGEPEAGQDQEKLAAMIALERLSQQETAELEAMATRLFAATDWQEWLPEVAHAQTVKPLMEWYYTKGGKELEAVNGVALGDFQRSHAGRETLRLQVSTASHASVWLPLLRESGRWKLDWEAYSGADVLRWAAFLREPAGTSIEVRLQVALKPGADPYLVKARIPLKGFKAVHLWSYERAAMAAAILADKNAVWGALKGIDYNNAAKIIARVTMIAPEMEPPLIRIDSVVEQGWLRREDAP